MKIFSSLLVLSVVALAGCGASNPEPVSSASLTSAQQTPAERWAEQKVAKEQAAEAQKKESAPALTAKETAEQSKAMDPLAVNSELEEASIPKVELTPAKQVRARTPQQLNAAMGIVKSAGTVDNAAKKITQRLGRPNWVESPKGADSSKKRIWIAPAGNQCHRLILDADGSVEVETASKTEWRMLAASARQNPCTGEIQRGLSAK